MAQRQRFLQFWWGQTASLLGDTTCLALLPLIAGLHLSASPGQMGILGFAISLPFLLLALPAGVLVDRVSRRRVLILADLVRAAAMAGLMLAMFFDALSLPALYLTALTVASATLFFDVAAQSILPELVSADGYVGANSGLELSRSAGTAGGPALAASLLQAFGALAPLAVSMLFYLGAAGLYAGLPERSRPVAPHSGALREVAEGMAFVVRHPVLRALTLCALLWNVAWFVFNTVFVLHAGSSLGLSAGEIGIALSLQGVGMGMGALIARPLVGRLGIGISLLVGPVTSAAALPVLLLAGPGTALPMAGAALFLLGIGPSVWTVTQTSLRQAVTPSSLLGRVNATIRFATAGMRPLGAILGGALGSLIGIEATVAAAGLLFGLCILPVALSSAARLKIMPGAA
ncbi:MFS transporter [Lacibacterium aquatile]|uniref:MFS transporter n=1 Tax=Lacibacterium aquatile TaxID=1168082 RepID=A0ABW5DVW1_9PROT